MQRRNITTRHGSEPAAEAAADTVAGDEKAAHGGQ